MADLVKQEDIETPMWSVTGDKDHIDGLIAAKAKAQRYEAALRRIATWRTTGHDRATFWRVEQIARDALDPQSDNGSAAQ